MWFKITINISCTFVSAQLRFIREMFILGKITKRKICHHRKGGKRLVPIAQLIMNPVFNTMCRLRYSDLLTFLLRCIKYLWKIITFSQLNCNEISNRKEQEKSLISALCLMAANRKNIAYKSGIDDYNTPV